MSERGNILALSIDDTNIMKGIAIIAMLFHHLYCSIPNWATLTNSNILCWLGAIGKVCVAMFVFCSGYGLGGQFQKNQSKPISFILRRFIKFYANYWVIFLLFVPISVFLFNRPLSLVYGRGHFHILSCLCTDIFGLRGFDSYNITWWFNKLIIILYLIFPLCFYSCKKCWWAFLVVSFALYLFNLEISNGFFSNVLVYGFPYAIGIFWSTNLATDSHVNLTLSKHIAALRIGAILFFATSVFLWHLAIIPRLKMTTAITCSFALLIVSFKPFLSNKLALLGTIGKLSANVYLMHTFFSSYWPTAILIHNYLPGIWKFIILFTICILCSYFIEWCKQRSGFNIKISQFASRI